MKEAGLGSKYLVLPGKTFQTVTWSRQDCLSPATAA
jgi:hypothetical protein